MSDVLEPGRVFDNPYPFSRELKTLLDEDGYHETITWVPGVRFIVVYPGDDTEDICDGLGRQVLTIVSTHKPGRFPERVFYQRYWVTPEGRKFGKPRCHIATAQKFRRLTRGYGHRFREATPAEKESHRATLIEKRDAA